MVLWLGKMVLEDEDWKEMKKDCQKMKIVNLY